MTRILLVGCGITSSITGYLLRKALPLLDLSIWDKSGSIGGRMSTRRSPHNASVTIDLGAQYISTTPDYAHIHKSYYEELEVSKVLLSFLSSIEGMKAQDGTQLYVAPAGISSIVKCFLEKANCKLSLGHHVKAIHSENNKWEVSTFSGDSDLFDVVILTMPIPEILCLSGTLKDIFGRKAPLTNALQSVQYSSRFSLGLFYPDGAQMMLPNGSVAQYITSDPIIRFVSIDNLKRGLGNVPPSVVIHTSVPFGKTHIEHPPDEVELLIMDRLRKLFPSWPEPISVKCHKWTFSQVTCAYAGLPGVIELDKGLYAGGDGFTHSNLDGCIESAEAVSRTVLQYVNNYHS